MGDKIQGKRITLYNDKSDCCGCGACMNICEKKAISMQPDEHGFIYPKIDKNICINCGLCKKVCGYQAEMTLPEINNTYVAVAKNSKILETSASGGVFAALATEVIKNGGVAFGCSMEHENDKLIAKHIMVDNLDHLIKLQGSKYVQSYIGDTYALAKKELEQGRLVLFSGTPCQIDGLKHYLMKDYENLVTLDLICHGVPCTQIFQDYISELEKKLRGQIVDFKFRDKSKGWTSYESRLKLIKHNKTIDKSLTNNSYNSMFLNSLISRESCYSCKYANSNRVGDLTIGDFWGIEDEHPQYLKSIDISKGVSCVIFNNTHGARIFGDLCKDIELLPSEFDKAARANTQLNRPSNRSEKREIVLNIYKNGGYSAVEKWYKKSQGIKFYISIVKGLLPNKLKSTLKRLLKK